MKHALFIPKSDAVWDKFCTQNRVATQAEKSQMIKFKYEKIKLKKNNMKWNMPNISTTLFQKPSAITRLNG
jgi:hypothetical protein